MICVQLVSFGFPDTKLKKCENKGSSSIRESPLRGPNNRWLIHCSEDADDDLCEQRAKMIIPLIYGLTITGYLLLYTRGGRGIDSNTRWYLL